VRVSAALDRIERERDNRAYLVGASFTVADLTAASLLSPLLQPPEIQYPGISQSSSRPRSTMVS
jgi:glutathione S-transferase